MKIILRPYLIGIVFSLLLFVGCVPAEEEVLYCETYLDCDAGWECIDHACINIPQNDETGTGDGQMLPEKEEAVSDDATDEFSDTPDELAVDDVTTEGDDQSVVDDDTAAGDDETVIDQDTAVVDDAPFIDEDVAVVDDQPVIDEDTAVVDDQPVIDQDLTPDVDPASCIGEWTYDAVTGKCYKYVATAATWTAAQADCAAQSAHLAEANTTAHNQSMSDMIPINNYFWFGINDYPTAVSGGPGPATPQVVVDGAHGGTYAGDTGDATNSATLSCIGVSGMFTGKDEWFQFTPTVTGTWIFKVAPTQNGSSVDVQIMIHASNATSPANWAKCVDVGTGGAAESMTYAVTAGTTYYVHVDGYQSNGPYVVEFIPPTTLLPTLPSGAYRAFRWDGGETVWDNTSFMGFTTGEPNLNTPGSSNQSRYLSVRCGLGWKGDLGSAAIWLDDDCALTKPYICEK